MFEDQDIEVNVTLTIKRKKHSQTLRCSVCDLDMTLASMFVKAKRQVESEKHVHGSKCKSLSMVGGSSGTD